MHFWTTKTFMKVYDNYGVYAETASSVVGQAQSVDGSVHSHTHVASERPAVGRVPLQSCGNTHCDMFTSPEVPAPVLSSVAQQCLRSGFKPNWRTHTVAVAVVFTILKPLLHNGKTSYLLSMLFWENRKKTFFAMHFPTVLCCFTVC